MQTNSWLLVLLMAALGVALFVGIWLGVCFLIGIKWRQVAARYPAPARTEETAKERWVAIRGIFLSGGARYKRCLEVTPEVGGIHLAVKWPFNVGTEPMLVPWSCVVGMEQKEGWEEGDISRWIWRWMGRCCDWICRWSPRRFCGEMTGHCRT